MRNRRERRFRPWHLVVIIPLVVIVGLPLYFFLGSLPRTPTHLLNVANELAVPAGATVSLDSVHPARWVCIGDVPCPSLSRTWQLHGAFTTAQFTSLVDGTGWDLGIDGPCGLATNVGGRQAACRATGVVDGIDVDLVLRGDIEDPSDMYLYLSLRPAA